MIRSRVKFVDYLYQRRYVTITNPTYVKGSSTKENCSFVANIFIGKFVPSQVFPYPDLLTIEQKDITSNLTDSFSKFFQNDNDAEQNDLKSKINERTLKKLWELGAFGIQVPNEYGGLGLNNTQYARLCEIVGANDLGLGITIGAHQSIGFKGILLYGTPKQKMKYLPKVSNDGIYAAFALTEPNSGSDAGSMRSRAVKTADGNHYVLNGSKLWISNGGFAEVMTVFAQTEVINKNTGEKKDKVTAFIIERSFGGVSSGKPEDKMGIRGSNTAEVTFENVRVPKENILGEEGEGFKVAMNILNNGRFGMGATLAGTMRYCIRKSIEHVNNRTQFGKKLREYGSIQEKIARMNMYQYVTESMTYTISQNMDSGSQDYQLEAAISKIFGSEAAWYVCDEAIQILGGLGFMRGSGLERVLRDLRIFRIFEGTNDILRLFVALSGTQYAGAQLNEFQNAFSNPITNVSFIFEEVSRRITSSIGLNDLGLGSHVVSDLQPYAKSVSMCINTFGKTVESLLIRYGKDIIHEQLILNKLADAAIDIYAMIVTLSRSSRAACLHLPTAAHELNLTKSWCLEATDRCQINLAKTTCRRHLKLHHNFGAIAKNVCDSNGVSTTHVICN